MNYIYKIIFPNNKVYIGKSSNPLKRFEDHFYIAKHELRNTMLCRALRKYNMQTIILDIIDYGEFTFEINWKEQEWIRKLNSNNKLYGYNMTTGGDGGNTYDKISKERKKELSKIRSNKWKENNPGTLYKKETRDKIADSVSYHMQNMTFIEKENLKKQISIGVNKHYHSNKGIKHKSCISKKMSGDKNPMSLQSISKRWNCSLEEAKKLAPKYGKHQSSYAKQKASETHKGKVVSKETKDKIIENKLKYKYIITNTETNQVFETRNLNQWCKDNNISYGILMHRATKKETRSRRSFKKWNIKRVCNG